MPQPHPTQDLCIPFTQWRALVRAADAQAAQAAQAAAPSRPKAPTPTAPLPPGIVLDADGKPCKVCNSWKTWAKIGKKKEAGTAAGTAATANTTANAPSAPASATASARPLDCPPDVESLGRATWTFLHTTAAYYPSHASPSQQSSMRGLLRGVADFYPCSYCREDFAARSAAVPPDVEGREALSRWLCERHNEVNQRLGKEAFDCAKVMERWKDGPADGRCD